MWKNYTAKAVNWAVYVENLSLADGKRFFKGRCVLGGFDNTKSGVLYSGTKDEVKAETKKLIDEAGKTGVIVGADCTVPADIAHERFGWVKEALLEI